MQKTLVVFVAVVLCLSSSALALIGHVQGFTMNGTNLVERSGQLGSAKNVNVAAIGQCHVTHRPFGGRPLVQKGHGYLEQRAKAVGRGGSSSADQDASAWGLQGQLIAGRPTNLSAEGQLLSADLGTTTTSQGGPARAKGKQTFIGGQTQKLATPGGWGQQTQCVGIAQNSLVETKPRGSASVTSNVNVTAGQLRIVTGPGPITLPVIPAR